MHSLTTVLRPAFLSSRSFVDDRLDVRGRGAGVRADHIHTSVNLSEGCTLSSPITDVGDRGVADRGALGRRHRRRPQRSPGLQRVLGTNWIGSLSLDDGLPRGPYTMVIEASNAGGETAQVSRGFTYDKLPVIKIIQPANGAIGQPDIPIKAECIDDGPTLRVESRVRSASQDPSTHAIRHGHPPHRIDSRFPDFPRRPIRRAASVRSQSATYFVSMRGGLSMSRTPSRATILDIDAGRALTFDDTGDAVRRTPLRPRRGHQPDHLDRGQRRRIRASRFLDSPDNGALFVMRRRSDQSYEQLFEWRGGALTQIGSVHRASRWWSRAPGRRSSGTAPCCQAMLLFLRDLTAGTNIQAATDPGVGRASTWRPTAAWSSASSVAPTKSSSSIRIRRPARRRN